MNFTKLIMVVGLPGTGKSTFSRALAGKLGARHLNSDIVRTELGLRDQYRPEDKARVYEELLNRSKNLLVSGHTVIVDATLYREDLRQPYLDAARTLSCPILWIELHTPEESIKKRVAKQRAYSQADFAVYRKIKKDYEPLKEVHLSLNTDEMALDALVNAAIKFIDTYEPTGN